MQRGAFAEAKAICADALTRNPDDGEALFLLGSALAQSGEIDSAIATLERARKVAPHNVLVLNALGGAYGVARRTEEAIKTLNLALTVDPGFPWARQNLALALKSTGDVAAARRQFERALDAHPDFPDALAGLAEVLLIYGDNDGAARLADRAIQCAPGHITARLAQAECALRRGAPQQTLDLLTTLNASAALEQARALKLRARAWERLENYSKAFEAFRAANRILRDYLAPTFDGGGGLLAPRTVAAITDFIGANGAPNWPRPTPPGRTPTFLLGFPRSGTTLLDQILAAHPEVETLEESMNFADALEPLILGPDAFARWATLTQSELDGFVDAYWRRVTTALGRPPSKPVFVDKLPLNTVLLPLIHLLFPEAKIIFAVRDPRDVAISCFTQSFEMNVAMFQFLSLEGAARYYDAIMRLAATARSSLPVNVHMVRYEDVVANFDGTVGGLLSFLQLSWREEVRGYHERARERLIRTPSAEQVRKPIYGSSISRWRRYEEHFAPLDGLLGNWISTFGYT